MDTATIRLGLPRLEVVGTKSDRDYVRVCRSELKARFTDRERLQVHHLLGGDEHGQEYHL